MIVYVSPSGITGCFHFFQRFGAMGFEASRAAKSSAAPSLAPGVERYHPTRPLDSPSCADGRLRSPFGLAIRESNGYSIVDSLDKTLQNQ